MAINRRHLLLGTAVSALVAAPASALTEADARAFIQRVTDDLIEIVRSASPGDPRANAFLDLFKRVAALDAIGRFTLGVHWRAMSDAQRQAFLDAFERYAARAYTNRIGEYTGQTLELLGTQDVGQRGIVVRSALKQEGAEDIAIDWLVSDRGGSTQVVDIVAEGVSLSIAQREEFASMIERRGNNYDDFISDLDTLG
jgi:phospholipid transport system substrate-binding protein